MFGKIRGRGKGRHTNTTPPQDPSPTASPLPNIGHSYRHFIKHFSGNYFQGMSTSGEFSATSSPASSFANFFRQLISPARKSPTNSFSSPLPCGSDDIQQAFNYFDENGDGKISASELQNRLKKVGGEELQLSDEEAEIAVRSSDADGDGMLGLEDFAKMMKEGEGEEEELREAFVMYSRKSTSREAECVITPKSLKKMMMRLGQSTCTVNDCKTMIGKFDVNGDGVLDFDEFRAMMSYQ